MASKARLAKPLVAIALVAMMTCAIFISVFATTNAQASFATFEKGDKFALKGEKDFSLGYYSVNQLFAFGNDETWLRDATVDNASLNGYMSSAMVYEVIDVTADEYVMKIVTAQNVSMSVQLLLTGELVDTGSYITDWDEGYSTNPNGLMNISEATAHLDTFGFDAKLVAGSNATYIVHMQKSDMAIKSVDMVSSTYARGHLSTYNFPNTTTDSDSDNSIETMNVTSYQSLNGNITMDLEMTGQMTFDPYVAMVKDAPAEGSNWETETYVNGTFNWTGLLDVTGLPDSVTDEIFTDDAAEHGITGFPIDLAKYHNSDADLAIDNGTAKIVAEHAHFEFSNLGNEVVNDPVYGNITIYRMGFNNATKDNYLEAWYYPAKGCLVGIELNYPIQKIAKLHLDMKTVATADAEKSITAISDQVNGKKAYEEVNAVTDVDASSSSNSLSDLLPIIGLIAVVLVVVVGAAFFLLKRKGKPKA
ncbi:MAG: hypothetical protein SA339_14165 [Methanomassiliicoccus sp.]|nr:hypothetical protein [Methanomassiliicoccus sp.]